MNSTKKLDADPALKMWYSIQQSLIGDQGQSYFDANVKDAEIPGGANDVKYFKGTVISVDPADKPTKIVLGVFDPTNARRNADLRRAGHLAGEGRRRTWNSPVWPTASSRTPYMLVFKDPEVPSLKKAAARQEDDP